MRVIVLVKADEKTEAGVMPTEELISAMMKFNQELADAGVMVDGQGLQPSSKGVRVQFSADRRTVVDGPFAESKELVAGYWLWDVDSLQDAIEWAKRCPNPSVDGETGEAVIEIRPLFEAEDFGDEFTPELREQEQRIRAQVTEKS